MYFTEEPDPIRQLRETLRRFVEDELPPGLRRQLDREHRFPPELFRKLADLGVCGLTIDEQYGGQGVDLVAAVATIEELCRGGAFLAGPFIHCAFYGGMNMMENGSDEQKEAYLPRLANGDLLFAYGLSEPEVGGDLASVTTTAELSEDGQHIKVNGFKRWCTGADWVDYIYTLVRSGPEEDRYRNLSFLLIPPTLPGVQVNPIEHSNLRYTLSSDVIFDNVEVPVANIVGGSEMWNRGWSLLAGRALDVEKIEITAVTFGIAQADCRRSLGICGPASPIRQTHLGASGDSTRSRRCAHQARSLPPNALPRRVARERKQAVLRRNLDGQALRRGYRC